VTEVTTDTGTLAIRAPGNAARAANSATLLAGAAKRDLTPEVGVALMGYGARTGNSRGVADRLHARALAIQANSGHPILLVSADLCLITTEQAARLRSRIAAELSIPDAGVVVACTHTHSGPETGMSETAAGRPEPPHVAPLFEGMVAAASEAWRQLRPARLRWAEGEAHIGRNRRIAEGTIDPGLEVLHAAGLDGRPIAVLFRHGCHGTVRGHENLEMSADWPGAAAAVIEAETGAVAPFLLGAHADVDPRTRGLMDLAIPGQSVGLGADAVRVLGREVADAVLQCLARTEAVPSDSQVDARRERLRLPIWLGELSPSDARESLERRKREIAELLGRTDGSLPRAADLYDLASESARGLPAAAAREQIARIRSYLRDRYAPHFAGGARELDVEVQVLAIGRARLLALPLEPTSAVGLDWRTRVPAGRLGLVVGIANGWLRYLPHASDLAHPHAHQHYEVLQSLLAPGAAEALLERGAKLARELDSD
jgi:hypothetical protein